MTKGNKKWNFFRENSTRVNKIFSANLITSLLPGSFGILLYYVVNELSQQSARGDQADYSNLQILCGAYVGFFLAYIALSMWSQRINHFNAYEVSTDLRLRFGDKLRMLPMSFFKDNNPGDITSRALGDVQKAENIVARVIPDLTTSAVTPIILGLFLLTINLPLACIALGAAALSGLALYLTRRAVRRIGNRHLKAVVAASSRFLEYFRTIKLLKSFDLTGERFDTMDAAMRFLKTSCFRTEVWTAIPVQIFLFLLDLGYLLLVLATVQALAAGALTWQGTLSFVVAGFFFFEGVKSIGPMVVELGFISVSTRRIGEVFEAEDMSFDPNCPVPRGNEIVFEKVGFAYRGTPVLKDVSCRIPENALTALVGLSGSGKSTMTSLMSRFWDVGSGRILLGGVPLTSIAPDVLLGRFATVFQDVFLFNDTVANNIRIGRKDATMEEVMEAARKARCHDFISALPKGYDTVVGERGNSLSGGEKQRISIARAILKDAPIIILDEATASLDPENEAEIQKAFESLIREKTVIAIAHQFAPIANAEQILVLDNGNIIERGRHHDLLKREGLYRRLWDKQQVARSWKLA